MLLRRRLVLLLGRRLILVLLLLRWGLVLLLLLLLLEHRTGVHKRRLDLALVAPAPRSGPATGRSSRNRGLVRVGKWVLALRMIGPVHDGLIYGTLLLMYRRRDGLMLMLVVIQVLVEWNNTTGCACAPLMLLDWRGSSGWLLLLLGKR